MPHNSTTQRRPAASALVSFKREDITCIVSKSLCISLHGHEQKKKILPSRKYTNKTKEVLLWKKMWKPLMNLLALACLRRVFAYPYMNMNQKVVLSSQKIKKNLKHTGEMKEKYDDITHYNKY